MPMGSYKLAQTLPENDTREALEKVRNAISQQKGQSRAVVIEDAKKAIR